ncbi:hypothetical protein KFK09_017632 [Dendrobium nobile]|uniref:Zinc knuckle CX2CX4HX4C domain-containing protein n=1 Tax=Dendrobium nobile TaxID=94219 RepID=A0A8T3B7U9_DENNO|nr:hypothetical protein KFK09_017632 [Dendrobium nobile]
MVGKPYLIDGNMFQWGRREFGRVCIRINLESKLPLGVWIEEKTGRFHQKIEYERIPIFYFNCGIIGHNKESYKEGNGDNSIAEEVSGSGTNNAGRNSQAANRAVGSVEETGYGPLLQ